MTEVLRGGKSIVAARTMKKYSQTVLELLPHQLASFAALSATEIANRKTAKAAMITKMLDESQSPSISPDGEKQHNSSLSGSHTPGLHGTFVLYHTRNVGKSVPIHALFDTVTWKVQGPSQEVLRRRLRIMYQQASRRKKLYMKQISKEHTVEECIALAKAKHF